MLHYTTYEHDTSKEWVTFVHGAGASSTIWYKQVRDFKKNFNVLLLDLRGHGQSKKLNIKDAFKDKYTFDYITDDIVDVINHLNIEKSHFIGISLGTILIRNLAEKYPEKVASMIMGGAVVKLNMRSQVLMKLGIVFKSVVPYIWLYKFIAFIIMPNKNHRESRSLFVREARKLYQKEFSRWFHLTSELNPLLRFLRASKVKIRTLYIMGEEDYLFLPSIKEIVKKHESSELFVVEKCGHIVNVERPITFNEVAIDFIKA